MGVNGSMRCAVPHRMARLRSRRLAAKGSERAGQMTVELCVVFPVAIAIAVIATNALSFFGCCAEFDRVGRNAVRTFAAVPAYGQDSGFAAGRVKAAIEGSLAADNLEFDVAVSRDYRGYAEYGMTMRFHPTLFGMGLTREVFGVPLPALTHESQLVVNPYKPGGLL